MLSMDASMCRVRRADMTSCCGWTMCKGSAEFSVPMFRRHFSRHPEVHRASACGRRNSSPPPERRRVSSCIHVVPVLSARTAATEMVDDMEGLLARLSQIDAVRVPRHAEPRQTGFKRLRAGG